MRRVPVESDNLKSVGYDEVSQTLEVEFNNGKVYQYFDLPAALHSQLMKAESHGKFFNASIRNANFKTVKVS